MRRIQLFAYSLVLGLTACGGGGGGGGEQSSAPANTFPPQVPLVYSGAGTAATVTATNTGMIASNVIGANAGAASGGLAGVSAQAESNPPSAQPTGVTGLTRRLTQAMRSDALAGARSGGWLAGAAKDETTLCDSGSVRVSGTLADNGTGTVSVAYNACRTGTDTINGPASFAIKDFDQTNHIVTDGTLSFTRVNFTGPGIDSDLTGTLHIQVNVSSATQTLTQKFITKDNTTGRMTKTEDLAITNVFDDVTAPTFYTQSITGRVFDSVAGFVDVTTTTAPFTAPWGPLYYATSTQAFPDWGIIDLTGAAGSHVRVMSFGVDLAKVQVDANGDGTFENTARLRWADFNTAIGADLADNDGDGMHNSWETAYGLNPNVNDAAGDADGDGYSNLTEYLAGSSPATNGSIPSAVRHLWVTNVRDLAADPASGMINVFVGDTGSGIQLDPVTRELGAAFSGVTEPNGSNNRTVTDAQGRTFTLAPTATPTTWTLTSSTGGSLTITNVAGTDAGSLIRYGARGLAFRTVGASSPGYVYLVESTQLIP
jgi:hypothetical protein